MTVLLVVLAENLYLDYIKFWVNKVTENEYLFH